jgi:hypothetical protein
MSSSWKIGSTVKKPQGGRACIRVPDVGLQLGGLLNSIVCFPYRFLAEALGLQDFKHDFRVSVQLDYAAWMCMWVSAQAGQPRNNSTWPCAGLHLSAMHGVHYRIDVTAFALCAGFATSFSSMGSRRQL